MAKKVCYVIVKGRGVEDGAPILISVTPLGGALLERLLDTFAEVRLGDWKVTNATFISGYSGPVYKGYETFDAAIEDLSRLLKRAEPLETYPDYKGVKIFTDGSGLNNARDEKDELDRSKQCAASAIVVVEKGKVIYTKAVWLGFGKNSAHGEAEAVKGALYYILDNALEEVVIETDSKLIVAILQGRDNATASMLKDVLILFQKVKLSGCNVRIEHVKGHAGNEFNELADKLANDCYEGGKNGKR